MSRWGVFENGREHECVGTDSIYRCDRYEVNEERGFVVHHVEINFVPNSVGTDLKRHISMKGNRLQLRPEEPLPKGVLEYTLNWERVSGPAVGRPKR